MNFYITVLLIYLGTDVIATWGLNLQFGVAGVLNLAFIVELSIGAYVYAMCTLGPSSGNGGFQHYLFGLHLPVPVALLAAIAAGAASGVLFGLVGLKRLRPDYQAIALLVVAVVATTVASTDIGLVGGNAGLTLIPNPLGGTGPGGNAWGSVALVWILCVLSYLLLRRLTDGPLGRSLRAVRDDNRAALAIGKNVRGLRLMVQGVGGGYAALSGALLVGFIGAWSPSAWQYVETMSLLTAVVVGGMGNNFGIVLGTLLVPVLLQQGAQYVPQIANRPGGAEDLGWIVTGILTIAFLWWRPRGIVPDQRPKYGGLGRIRRRPRVIPKPRARSTEPAGAALAGPALASATPSGSLASPSLRMDLHGAGGASSADGEVGKPILSVSSVEISFGGLRAVDQASFDVRRGAITGLIGPNGAGKSTLINAMSGFQSLDAGSVYFEGADVTSWGPERRARAGLVRTFQLSREFAGLTTIENLLVAPLRQRAETTAGVLLGPRYWGKEEDVNRARAWALLDRFEMTDKANELAGNLSGGQKRMVELMRALMANPSMLLLDEPIAGLSRRWSGLLEDAVLDLRRTGLSVILVEHELGVVERLCDSVIVMAAGRVLTEGSMAELRQREDVQAAYVIG
jgi:branched-chain amino acid transport system permease protein